MSLNDAWMDVLTPPRTRAASAVFMPLVSLTALRLIRSWNQTGQKFAGEPDIVKLFLYEYPMLLWVLVGLTYATLSFQILPSFEGLPYIAATGLTALLISTASSFKLAFAAEDVPELVVGLAKALNDNFQGQSLLLRARVVFALLGIATSAAIYHSRTGGPRAARTSGKFSVSIMTTWLLTWNISTATAPPHDPPCNHPIPRHQRPLAPPLCYDLPPPPIPFPLHRGNHYHVYPPPVHNILRLRRV